jgi:hypothetical protein
MVWLDLIDKKEEINIKCDIFKSAFPEIDPSINCHTCTKNKCCNINCKTSCSLYEEILYYEKTN